MMLAALLWLSHFPLLGNADLPVSDPPAVVAQVPNTTSSAVTSNELSAPSVQPPAKVLEIADAHPSFAAPAVPALRRFPFQPIKPATRHGYITRNEKITWYSLMIAGHAGAVLDAWSTRRALSGNYGREADPLMRPFAHSSTLYLATQVTPLLMDIVGRRALMSERPWVHKLWWVPQTVVVSMSFQAGIHNIGVVH